MKTLDERYYKATLTRSDYAAAVYEFIDSLNTIDEVKSLWRDHFLPDDDFLNHCFGMACWARINKIEEKQNGKEKSKP